MSKLTSISPTTHYTEPLSSLVIPPASKSTSSMLGGGTRSKKFCYLNSPKQSLPTSSNTLLQLDARVPTDTPILDLWQHALINLFPEDFTTFTKAQEQAATPTCPDPSGHSKLIHTQNACFAYGEWQSVHGEHSCLQGLHKLLEIHLVPPLLSEPDIDQILVNGLPPSTWTSPIHFGPTERYLGLLHAPSLCGA